MQFKSFDSKQVEVPCLLIYSELVGYPALLMSGHPSVRQHFNKQIKQVKGHSIGCMIQWLIYKLLLLFSNHGWTLTFF
jgi:hypothetical protein